MKKSFIYVILIGLLLSVGILEINYFSSKRELKKQDNENNNVSYAILLEDGIDTNTYQPSSTNSWPGTNYKFNQERSGCIDNNGIEIDDALEFDDANQLVSLKVNKSLKCYMYFDKES